MKAAASVEDLPPPPPETLKQRVAYWQYRAVWEAAARLPHGLAARVPHQAGAAWYRMASTEQLDQVRRNLSRVLGHPPADQLERTVKAAYVSYARYWLDSFRLHTLSQEQVLARSTGENLELVDELVRQGGAPGDRASRVVGHRGVLHLPA